jgi:hypothetical protein
MLLMLTFAPPGVGERRVGERLSGQEFRGVPPHLLGEPARHGQAGLVDPVPQAQQG